MLEADYKIPVIVNVYPGRVRQSDTPQGLAILREQMTKWIQRDLTATLRIGNLLTGALYVDLNHDPEAIPAKISTLHDYEIIPTSSTEFTQITQKAEALLDKLNALPLETLSGDMATAFTAMGEAADSVRASSANFDALIADVDMQAINQELVSLLQQMSVLVTRISESGLMDDAALKSVNELQETLRQVQPLIQQLNQAPNRLIFGNNDDTVEPKAKETQ